MQSTTVPLHSANEPEKTEVDSDLKALRSDFESLKENVGSLMTSVSRLAGKKAEKGVDKGTAIKDDAVDAFQDAKGSFESQIRAKPLAAVGIAVGVGALLAIMTRK
ncbi:MAG: hypothetical protein CMK06_04995 [Ponticaulis sp.]|nr:hypothetical protein [Ponticaulis sp.]|tara:strand:- start:15140 stop:15457 length:318 start_codon:yes stop_codon:yes gene_type:complete